MAGTLLPRDRGPSKRAAEVHHRWVSVGSGPAFPQGYCWWLAALMATTPMKLNNTGVMAYTTRTRRSVRITSAASVIPTAAKTKLMPYNSSTAPPGPTGQGRGPSGNGRDPRSEVPSIHGPGQPLR